MNREFSESKSNGIVNWSFIGERLAVRHKRELSSVIEELKSELKNLLKNVLRSESRNESRN